jgi:dipeptidyl aminopeptidase/acylaminoacyl peptidase
VPKPYGTFAFVQGTAAPRAFILGAQRLANFPDGAYPATKLYLLRLNPSAPPGHQAVLTAMAVPGLRPERGYQLTWLALSPNGQRLAAISTTTSNGESTQLRVYDIVTGVSRTWVLPQWAGRLDTFSDVTGPPSWKADSRTLAFFDRTATGSAELVLLDTTAPAATFGADTTTVQLPQPPRTDEVTFGPDSPLLTPDGQHVLERVVSRREVNPAFALELVNIRTGTVQMLRQRSQMLFVLASDPSGSAVIEAEGNLPPLAQGILAWTARHITPIDVPPDTIALAW